MSNRAGVVRERQDPLLKRYKEVPDEAVITDRARTTGGVDSDPFHGHVIVGNDEHDVRIPFGIHRAVGGFHDMPNPGDMLCAAVAACLDSTIRIIAERLRVTLTSLEVEVTAKVDVRGTLLVEKDVPVGFQSICCNVKIQAADGTNPNLINKIAGASEHCCVNIQTLLSNVSVEMNLDEA